MVQILKFVSGKQVVSVLVYLLAFAFALPSDTMAVVMLQAWEEKDLPLRWTHRFSLPDWKLQNTSCKESSSISHLLFTSSPAQIRGRIIRSVPVDVIYGVICAWSGSVERMTYQSMNIHVFPNIHVCIPIVFHESENFPFCT